jgi:hypothetical protein
MERKSRDGEKRGGGGKGGGDEGKGRRRKMFMKRKTKGIRGHGMKRFIDMEGILLYVYGL